MSNRERHQRRDAVAHVNGYRPQPSPAEVDYAGTRLPESVDQRAAAAALELRGLPPTQDATVTTIKRARRVA